MSKRAKARRTAAKVQQSTALHGFARAGFLFNGILHMLVGVLAFAIAFGRPSEANHEGALRQLSSGPIGGLLLWATVLALFGLGFFQLLTLVLVRGTTREDWLARAKPFGRAAAYLTLGTIAFRFAVGGEPKGSEAQEVSAGLLAVGGGWIVALIGVAILIGGISYIVIGIRGRFLDDLKTRRVPVNKAARVLGTIGYIAEGIAIATIGVLFLITAFTSDPDNAGGLDGALETLSNLPSGNVVLSAIALGFILFGLYCFIRAKYERLEKP